MYYHIQIQAKCDRHFSIKLRRILRKIELFLGWNFILMMVVSSNLKISIYIFLNLAYPDLRTGLGVISLICSIGVAILNILLVGYLTKIILRSHENTKNKNNQGQVRSLPSRAERNFAQKYKILFEDYNNDTIWQPLYVPLLFIRSIAIGALLVLFKSYGFAAALFLFLMSLAFVAYMIKHRPIKDKSNLVFQIIFDVIIMVVSLLVLTLSIMDMRKVSNPDIRLNIGWAITTANYLIQGLGLVKVLAIVVKLIYRKITQPKVIARGLPRLSNSTKPTTTTISDNNLSDTSMIKKPRRRTLFSTSNE